MGASNGLRAQPVGRLFQQSFWAAVLLVGGPSKAEKAVIQGIRSLKQRGLWAEDLLHGTVTAALQDPRHWQPTPEDLADAIEGLPAELGRVLRLPSIVRHCFVLRTLMVMPVETCASLLGVDEDTVNRNASRAALLLPEIVRDEVAEAV